MAEPDPALTIRPAFPRCGPELLARFDKAPTGWVVDARGRRGAIDHRIRPQTRASRFVGSALTVQSRACDNLAPYAALAQAQPGDVLVIATDGHLEAAVVGDILVGMARNRGIVAVITDGLVRDVRGLDEVGIPVFARGLTPNSPYKDGPGSVGLPVVVGGVAIAPGDLIVGDIDGVVAVPREMAAGVADAVAEVEAKEAKMDALVRSGVGVPPWLEATLAAKGVRLVD